MIVELLMGAGLVLAGAAAARVFLRRADEDSLHGEPPPSAREPHRTAPRGLRVGDVLLHGDTELWLAGMIELDEEGLVARLFPAPGSVRAEWVAQLDEEANDLALLSKCDEVPAGEVPESLPIAGRRLTLERRGSAEIRVDGEHLPHTSGRARYWLLSDAGGRALIVVDFERAPRLALHGERVERFTVDLLPGGDLDEDGA